MKTPDKIFIAYEYSEADTLPPGVTTRRVFGKDVCYIREDLALSIADIEKLHTFLCAVKNNKQGAFTFTRLTDEQYEEVLRRFNNARKEEEQ